MKLKDLQKKGGFVPQQPKAREVTWKRTGPDGNEISDTFTVFVRRQSFGGMERVLSIDPNDPDRSRTAQYIAASICLGDAGEDTLSYADAYALEPSLAAVLLEAVNDANGVARGDPKN